MRTTTIYLVRHGQSLGNAMHAEGAHLRSVDEFESSLTELGKQQIRKTLQELSHIPFTHIYSSALRRATESAQLAADHFHIPSHVHLRLHERKIKSLENLSQGDIQKEFGSLIGYERTLPIEER